MTTKFYAGHRYAATMKNRALSLKEALNHLLHVPGSSLKKMYVSGGRREYFVMPNGDMVGEKDALAIIARPEIDVFEDGLFPGNPQSWRRR
jgi:hypothetical protein